MTNMKSRKYARTSMKTNSKNKVSDETELSISSTAALAILGGTFLVGLISGKLMCMCIKKC